ARDIAAAQYREGTAKGRASHRLQDVLAAAYQGRIAALFVPIGLRRWGRFDFERLALEEHEEERTGDEELLDLAAMQALIHGRTVYQGLHGGEVKQFFISSPFFFMFFQGKALEIESAPASEANWDEQCGNTALIGCR